MQGAGGTEKPIGETIPHYSRSDAPRHTGYPKGAVRLKQRGTVFETVIDDPHLIQPIDNGGMAFAFEGLEEVPAHARITAVKRSDLDRDFAMQMLRTIRYGAAPCNAIRDAGEAVHIRPPFYCDGTKARNHPELLLCVRRAGRYAGQKKRQAQYSEPG